MRLRFSTLPDAHECIDTLRGVFDAPHGFHFSAQRLAPDRIDLAGALFLSRVLSYRWAVRSAPSRRWGAIPARGEPDRVDLKGADRVVQHLLYCAGLEPGTLHLPSLRDTAHVRNPLWANAAWAWPCARLIPDGRGRAHALIQGIGAAFQEHLQRELGSTTPGRLQACQGDAAFAVSFSSALLPRSGALRGIRSAQADNRFRACVRAFRQAVLAGLHERGIQVAVSVLGSAIRGWGRSADPSEFEGSLHAKIRGRWAPYLAFAPEGTRLVVASGERLASVEVCGQATVAGVMDPHGAAWRRVKDAIRLEKTPAYVDGRIAALTLPPTTG